MPRLPNDCEINRLSTFFIPYNRGFPLICYPNSRKFFLLDTCFCQHFKHDTNRTCPYIICILFNPSWMRIIVFYFFLCNSYHIAVMVKKNCTCTCRTLINCHYIFFHRNLLFIYFIIYEKTAHRKLFFHILYLLECIFPDITSFIFLICLCR